MTAPMCSVPGWYLTKYGLPFYIKPYSDEWWSVFDIRIARDEADWYGTNLAGLKRMLAPPYTPLEARRDTLRALANHFDEVGMAGPANEVRVQMRAESLEESGA